jgi:wyosine [tRNA(Phe)-imidazoG37] synthetase (radical SAM superfamily)
MPRSEKKADSMVGAWHNHARQWKNNRYVYAVISRRSRGISVGLNLNPDKACNFNCIYCQVNRNIPPAIRRVNLKKLEEELDAILQAEKDATLYEDAPFRLLAPERRGVRDIAFSGDGEPTTFRHFEEAVRIAAAARLRFGLQSTKLVLLTNAAYLDKPAVRAALRVLDENNGEIWAKLDAGTDAYFQKVDQAHISLERILGNILDAARARPVVIQSLWFRIHNAAPPVDEINAYCEQLEKLISAGGRIKTIQIHTIARDPADPHASPLSNKELDNIAAAVKSRLPVPTEVFYSAPQQS